MADAVLEQHVDSLKIANVTTTHLKDNADSYFNKKDTPNG